MKVQLNRVIGRERVLKFHLCDFEGSHRDVKEKKKKNIPIRFMFYGNKLFLERFKIYFLIKFHFHAKTHDPNISKKDPKGFENNFILHESDYWILY